MSVRYRREMVLGYVVLLAVAGLTLGCGGDKGTRVSGTVTFDGKPVPTGKIYFMPDGTKGNSGPTGYANIKDGKYDTAAPGSRGVTPGPNKVTIEGTDPSAPPAGETSGDVTSTLLFTGYETTADLPEAASTKDFDVPPEAAKGPVAPDVPMTVTP